MRTSFYIATSGILQGTARQQVAVNNLANITTVGFKRDQVVSFPATLALASAQTPDLVLASLQRESPTPASIGVGVATQEIVTDFSLGSLQETGQPLDLALTGKGFFRVETPQGERYTRDGRFGRDDQGRLATVDGYPVLGEAGPLTLGEGPVSIAEDGTVSSGGKALGKLSIVGFEDMSSLQKSGQNLFEAPPSTGKALPAKDVHLRQGCLEMSNVDLVEAVVEMMTVARIYQTNQEMIKTQDELLSRIINDLGRLA